MGIIWNLLSTAYPDDFPVVITLKLVIASGIIGLLLTNKLLSKPKINQ